MALLIGNWMSSHGTSMDVSTGAYFNSGVNKLKRSGRLKRDTRLGSDVWFKSTRRMAGMQPPVKLQYPQNRFMGLLFLCFVCNQLHFLCFVWVFYWLIKHCEVCEVCEVCECATLLHVRSRDRFLWLPCSTSAWLARVLPQDGNRESSLKVESLFACAIHIHSYSLNIIFVRWYTFDIHWYSCVKRLTLIDWWDLLLRCFSWDSNSAEADRWKLPSDCHPGHYRPGCRDRWFSCTKEACILMSLKLGLLNESIYFDSWCILVFWAIMTGPGSSVAPVGRHVSSLSICTDRLYPLVNARCDWCVAKNSLRWERRCIKKNPNKLGLVVTACGKEVDRDRFLSHKNIEFVKSIIPKFPWGKMLSYLGCGLQVVWIRRSVVSSRAAKNSLCLSYFGIRSTLRRTKKVLFFAPCAKLVNLRSSLGTRFPQGMPVCTCLFSEVVIDHYVPRLLARV